MFWLSLLIVRETKDGERWRMYVIKYVNVAKRGQKAFCCRKPNAAFTNSDLKGWARDSCHSLSARSGFAAVSSPRARQIQKELSYTAGKTRERISFMRMSSDAVLVTAGCGYLDSSRNSFLKLQLCYYHIYRFAVLLEPGFCQLLCIQMCGRTVMLFISLIIQYMKSHKLVKMIRMDIKLKATAPEMWLSLLINYFCWFIFS